MSCPPVTNVLKGVYVDNNPGLDKCLTAATAADGTISELNSQVCTFSYAGFPTLVNTPITNCIGDGKTTVLASCLSMDKRTAAMTQYLNKAKENDPNWDREGVVPVNPSPFGFRKRK